MESMWVCYHSPRLLFNQESVTNKTPALFVFHFLNRSFLLPLEQSQAVSGRILLFHSEKSLAYKYEREKQVEEREKRKWESDIWMFSAGWRHYDCHWLLIKAGVDQLTAHITHLYSPPHETCCSVHCMEHLSLLVLWGAPIHVGVQVHL